MPLTLVEHIALLEDEYNLSRAAPLSVRRALVVAVLVDGVADRFFGARRAQAQAVFGAEDLPAFRRIIAQKCEPLASLARLCEMGPLSPKLMIAPIPVPDENLVDLEIDDFMVSLYNGQSVQRVVLAFPDGATQLVHPLLAASLDWWRDLVAGASP